MPHLMVDLETLDVRATAVIIQVGAVAFDPTTGDVGEPRLWRVDPSSGQPGRTVSPGTVAWWCGLEGRALADAIAGPHVLLAEALFCLYAMVPRALDGPVRAWSHGATFDLVVLDDAARSLGVAPAWTFRECRDTRTLFDLAPPDWPENPDKHRADADALAQAVAVCSSYRKLGLAR